MAVWPASLPQDLLVEGLNIEEPDLTARTQMDFGPPKVRKRFTAGFTPVKGGVLLTKAQHATFNTFFLTTVNGGADKFDWKHPITSSTVEMRFTKPPRYSVIDGGPVGLIKADIELEILP